MYETITGVTNNQKEKNCIRPGKTRLYEKEGAKQNKRGGRPPDFLPA